MRAALRLPSAKSRLARLHQMVPVREEADEVEAALAESLRANNGVLNITLRLAKAVTNELLARCVFRRPTEEERKRDVTCEYFFDSRWIDEVLQEGDDR
jgi:hypothetical protein